MWDSIKNNVLLKSIVIMIFGVLGFGLAFNIMFGRNTGGMEQEMNAGNSYALNGTLAYILTVLVKLLLIAIVLVALIAVYQLAKKHLFDSSSSENKSFEALKNDPIIKTVSLIVVGVLAISIVAMLFSNIFGGYGMSSNYNYTMGTLNGFGLTSILIFLIKLLLGVSVVGFVVSIIYYIIQNPTKLSLEKIFSNTSTVVPKIVCSKCGIDMKPEWKCCPNCGEEVAQSKVSDSAFVNEAVEVVAETVVKEENEIQIIDDEQEEINTK